MRHRPLLVLVIKAEAGEDFGRAGRGTVGVDLDQAGPDLAHLLGLGGLEMRQQLVTVGIGLEDCLDDADGRRRVLLIDRTDAGGFGQ